LQSGIRTDCEFGIALSRISQGKKVPDFVKKEEEPRGPSVLLVCFYLKKQKPASVPLLFFIP